MERKNKPLQEEA